jgi:hypothetical protein
MNAIVASDRTELSHGEDGTNVTNVIAKEDTTETGKRAHEVGLEGDGRLDAADIGRSCEMSRHAGRFQMCKSKCKE